MSKGRVINRCLILISLVTGGLTMVWVQHLTRGCSRGMWACVCIRVCESVASGWPDITVLFLRKLELTRPPGWALLYLWWHWMQIHLQPGIAQIHVADIKFWQGATLCYTVRAHLGRSLVLSARTTLIKLPHWHCYTIPESSVLVRIRVFKYRLTYCQGHVV